MRAHRWAAWTAVAGTVFIAMAAFWLSFTALADLAARSGIGPGQAWAWPLIVDGIIVVATVAVVALAGQKSAWYPWALLIGGAVVSVTANALHAIVAADATVPGLLAAAIAAVPPVVLLAITHLTVILTHPTQQPVEPARTTITTHPEPAQPALADQPLPQLVTAPTPPPADEPDTDEPVADEQVLEEPPAPGSVETPAPTVEQPAGADPVAAKTGADRREAAVRWHQAGWSNKQIAAELGVHPSTVGRWFTTSGPSESSSTPSTEKEELKEES
ncbi:Putative phage excisionase [Propionibacterium freudenreichii]|nr:Putative phage excisionase [Propionibacterium freudenreichii]SCQ67258.1 Putative phage excisionase [Propionibacterium freudenreichii]